MTSVSTGPLPDSSLRPICSWSATNIEGVFVGSETEGRSLPGPAPTILGGVRSVPSRENLTRISNRPVIPVLSITGRPSTTRSVFESSSTVAPRPSIDGDMVLIRIPQYLAPCSRGGGGTDQG